MQPTTDIWLMHLTRSGHRMSPTPKTWPEWTVRGCITVHSRNRIRRIINHEEIYLPNVHTTTRSSERWDAHYLWETSGEWIGLDASCDIRIRSNSYREHRKQWEVDVRVMRQIIPWVEGIFVKPRTYHGHYIPKDPSISVQRGLFYGNKGILLNR